MTTKMSLHRIIATIKAIEAQLATIGIQQFVYQATGEDTNQEFETYRKNSQAAYDKLQSAIRNLATLKAARNLLNSTTKVNIASVNMTIDQALAFKASLPYKLQLINVLQSQFVAGQRQQEQAQAKIEEKVNQQVAAMFSGTKKATEDEVALVRKSVERGLKVTLLHGEGLKERIDLLKAEVAAFTTEIDYVLSEANATTTTDVTLV
jgi:hypothetical protein